jgi:metacaspase-1
MKQFFSVKMIYTKMEEEIRQAENWYQSQLSGLQNYVLRYIQSLRNARRLSWRQKMLYHGRIIQWFHSRKSYLAMQRDARIAGIRSRYPNKVVPVSTSNKKAVLVGINYEGTSAELKGCVNDVYKLRDMLVSQYGYTMSNIHMLINSDATRKNILHYFTLLLKSANPGDSICFTFSGHGYYTRDMYNKDEKDGYDELIVTADHKTIIDDEFKHLIQKHLKSNVNMFSLFDNCHSGTVYDLRYQYFDSSTNPKDVMTVQPNLIDTPGQVVLLSGCMDNQVSLDARINGKFNGVMTWVFVEALRMANYQDTWDSLLQRIRKILIQNKLEQIPQMSSGRQLDVQNKKVLI